jgi:hypothetical protein
MSPEDNALFDAASPTTLRRLLRRRGVFISKDTAKEDMRRLFGWMFTFQEWKELEDEQRSSPQSVGNTEGAPVKGVASETTPSPGRRADPLATEGNDRKE